MAVHYAPWRPITAPLLSSGARFEIPPLSIFLIQIFLNLLSMDFFLLAKVGTERGSHVTWWRHCRRSLVSYLSDEKGNKWQWNSNLNKASLSSAVWLQFRCLSDKRILKNPEESPQRILRVPALLSWFSRQGATISISIIERLYWVSQLLLVSF